ncbi:MAG: cupin domain-containing protein [Deltaproteobacteria bacterium]|nr:cupin domain-containing protein [Deltaproteobacteria bacterium]
MRNLRLKILILLLLVLSLAAVQDSHAQKKEAAKKEKAVMVIMTPDQVTWTAGPSALPQGAQAAVLEGDPTKSGTFTMRLKFPKGYKIPPHSHPHVEHVTVISGTFNLARGEKADKTAGISLPPGSFFMVSPNTAHTAWVDEETIVQLHGTGPWSIKYVNPSDDPRTKKK